YLATNSYLNTVGVCSIDPDVICLQTGLTLQELRDSTTQLMEEEIAYVKSYNNTIYFIVPSHFSTVSNSEASIEKMKSDLKSLPKQLVEFLKSIGISIDKKAKIFVEPTEIEVIEHALSQGYYVNGKEFIDYYRRQGALRGKEGTWMDSRGKRVIDWKSKMRNIWYREENKITLPKDAPKGWEYFYIIFKGQPVLPERWSDGQPKHSDFLINKEMSKCYREAQLKNTSVTV